MPQPPQLHRLPPPPLPPPLLPPPIFNQNLQNNYQIPAPVNIGPPVALLQPLQIAEARRPPHLAELDPLILASIEGNRADIVAGLQDLIESNKNSAEKTARDSNKSRAASVIQLTSTPHTKPRHFDPSNLDSNALKKMKEMMFFHFPEISNSLGYNSFDLLRDLLANTPFGEQIIAMALYDISLRKSVSNQRLLEAIECYSRVPFHFFSLSMSSAKKQIEYFILVFILFFRFVVEVTRILLFALQILLRAGCGTTSLLGNKRPPSKPMEAQISEYQN